MNLGPGRIKDLRERMGYDYRETGTEIRPVERTGELGHLTHLSALGVDDVVFGLAARHGAKTTTSSRRGRRLRRHLIHRRSGGIAVGRQLKLK